MTNTYLNLSHDDMRITHIIKNIITQFNDKMTIKQFKDNIIELDNIDDGTLSELDENIIIDFIESLSKTKYRTYILHLINDTTMMARGETIGSYMKFISMLKY